MENATPREGRKLAAVPELAPKHHVKHIAIHDQRIALI